MKIVIVGTAYPYRGGLAAFNERLALQFQAEGEDVSVETFTLQYPSFLFPGKTQYSNGTSPKLTISRSINSIHPINWIRVGRNIAKHQPDVVIFAYWMSFMSPCFGTIARVIKRHCNAKCIGLIHNMLPHEPSIIDSILSPYFVRIIDGFCTLSHSVVSDIEKFEKIEKLKVTVPHPIYDHYGEREDFTTARTKLSLPHHTHYILFFGFIRDYKGLDLLLEAMADNRMKENDIHLIVAGEFYGNEEKYKELTKHFGVEDMVTWFSEYIPDSQVNTYFNACELVVQPYKSATQSGVTQIAYHFEKPMIVTNVGGLAEIIPNGKVGYVVEPNSQAIADAIITYFTQANREEMVANIKIEKKKYAWENITREMRKLW